MTQVRTASPRILSTKYVSVPQAPRKYRPELQGLRALASLLVVVYHVWLDRISGGVDVFFLISGFLITGQLFRASSKGGIQYRAMWGRMIKRLFPAALTVLLVVMAVSVVLLPETRWFQTIREVVAAAVYLENWQLAADSVDYFAQHNTASAAQHFWSLSIQGQFYIVWPLLVTLVAVVARRTGQLLRRSLALTLTVVFAASLAYSVYLTKADQPLAYFHSLTRVWEFALGGLLALAIDWVTLPRNLRIVLGWLGVAGLVSCGLVLQVGSVFPGYVALWPTMSAVFVIAAGATGSAISADRILSSRPLEYLGNISYSLYLWHWPVLLFYLLARNRPSVGLLGGAFIIGVSIVLSVLTYHFVETPIRESKIGTVKPWGAYRFGVLALVVVLAAAGSWQFFGTQKADYTISTADPDHPGAQSREPGFQYQGAASPALVPPMISLTDDWARIPEKQCTYSPRNEDLQICTTPTNGPPARKIVIAGDSHAQQFIATLRPIAEQRNWQITAMLKGACPFSTQSETMIGDPGCKKWNADVVDQIAQLKPDAVLTLATHDVRSGLTEKTPAGFVEQWGKLNTLGVPVLAVRDFPRHKFSPPTCAEANGTDAPQCSTPRADVLSAIPPYQSIPDVTPNVHFFDYSNYLCTDTVCPPEIGNVRTYMDNNHPSATFMTTLAPVMDRDIQAALGW